MERAYEASMEHMKTFNENGSQQMEVEAIHKQKQCICCRLQQDFKNKTSC